MSEALEKEIKELKEQNAKITAKLEDSLKSVDDIKAVKAELVKSRDDLKKELSTQKNKKDDDTATVDDLKRMLAEERKGREADGEKTKSDRILAKLEKAAVKAGFVKDKDGNINMKLLKGQIDIKDLVLDDDGNLYGADAKLEELKKSDSYFFPKNAAPNSDPKINPKTVRGEDLGDEALEGKTFHERRAIMRKRGEKFTEDQKNGLTSGMGSNTGEATEAAASATQSE